MHAPLAILRALARPLAALGVVLTLMVTVVPVAAAGGLCIGADIIDSGTLDAPFCDACLVVALPPAPPPMLPERAVERAGVVPFPAEVLASRGPEAERIRDPPAI